VTLGRDTAAIEALRAAEIPAERHGRARTRRLSAVQRDFYFWILREFAAARPPSAEGARVAAASYRLEPVEAFEVLAREDLVHVDSDGRPVVAYPFSATARGHRVLIDGERWVEAMCAIDALGIAPMLGLSVEVYSRDPVSGGEVWVRLDPREGAWSEPNEAVVLGGSACCEGPSFRGCCDVLNFFETNANVERYLAENQSISGHPISLPDAIEAGRLVFGDVFTGED
jgi:Alkylmercury lyase